MSPRLLAAFAWILLLAGPLSAAEPFCFPEATYGKHELKHINGLPVLTVSGTPAEIGDAVGVLAVRPGSRMLSYPEDLLRHFHLHFLWKPFISAGKKLYEHFPPESQAELEAMVEGAGADRDHVIVGNTLFDLKKILACSALLVEGSRSATGAPLLGRNLDYPSLDYAQEYTLVTVYRPEGKHAFVSVGFPGLVGCLSGMNDAGLSLAVLEVLQVQAGKMKCDFSGVPYALCYRRLLEECTTIAEAKALLESMKRTAINNLVVADREGVAVFEVTPRRVVVRGPHQGGCICTNHFCSDELRPLARINFYKTLDRFGALEQCLAEHDRLGLVELQQGLHAANQQTKTMMTMVFDPAALRLHLATGTCPSSAAPMKCLELAPLFGPPAGPSGSAQK
jgi:isopenicillin-N N-acyltransferase-like protein